MKLLPKFLFVIVLMTGTSASWTGDSQTIEHWGEVHYQNYGKAEGRTLSANSNNEDYVRSYADLLAAYNLNLRSENHDRSFHSCSYAKTMLSCSGAQRETLSCGLVGSSTVTCAIEGAHGESFNSCSLIRRGFACVGNKGGVLNCKLEGRAVLCDYKSR